MRSYSPCDAAPVICIWDPTSPLRIVYRGEIVKGVKILNQGNAGQFVGANIFYARQPHVFTCKAWHGKK